MTKSLFRQSFVFDTLDLERSMHAHQHTLANGVQLKIHQRGVLEMIPAQYTPECKNIVVSCGIHGDETAPMELVDTIVNDIVSGFQPLRSRCLFIIAHPEATLAHTRFVDENLNRLFDDRSHGRNDSKEVHIAANLKAVMQAFYADTQVSTRWHLDLHCAIRDSKHYTFAISPKTRHPVRHKALFDFVDSAHIEAVLLSNSPSSTFSWFSAENFAANALTLELGKVARIGENNLDRLLAFDLALRDLLAQQESEHLPKPAKTYRVSRTIVRLNDDFGFLIADDVANFTTFKHGEVFGHDGDKPLMAKNDHEAIVFPNPHVAVGQRAAIMVCSVKTRYEDGQLVYD